MAILTLATKDLRLLLRDPRSAVILLVTPLLLIGVLYFALGEGFGEKPDERLRISVVNRDPAEAERLVAKGRRPAVIVFGADFSDRMHRCSFLSQPDAVNPLGRDG